MKIKITSDGTPRGTKVIDQKTGEELEGVLMLSWTMAAEEAVGVVTLELVGVPCDIVTEARNIQVSPLVQVPAGMVVEDEDWTWVKGSEQPDSDFAFEASEFRTQKKPWK